MKRSLLVIVIVLALASMTVGSTIAGFSDTEEVFDKIIPLRAAASTCWLPGLMPAGMAKKTTVTTSRGARASSPCS